MAHNIVQRNRNWRAIVIRDDAGVERLNALLEKGWYLEFIEMEGLPFLIFPVEREDFGSSDSEDAPLPGGHRNALPLVLVLTRHGRRRKQRGMIIRPDERGYFDLAWLDQALGAESNKVYGTVFFRMENGNRLAFVDWGEAA